MPLPVDVLPKVQKLVLLLSSDQPGEVAAAAAAIGLALKAADATWHDLAAKPTEPRVEHDPPPRRRSRPWHTPDVGAMLDDLLDHPGLTDWECCFVDSVHGQYRRRHRLSPRELDVLSRIWRKNGARAA